MKRAAILAVVLSTALAPAATLAAPPVGVSFTPDAWNFDMIRQGDVIDVTLTVTNSTPRPLAVKLIPLCDCLSVTPGSRTVPPDDEGTFALRYDSRDDRGIVRKNFLITTDAPGFEKAYFELRGTVRVEKGAAEAPDAAAGAAPEAAGARDGTVVVRYYYTPGCRSCETFLAKGLPRIGDALGLRVEVQRRDILDPDAYAELAAAAASLGQSLRAMPVLRAGDTLLQGEREIEAGARAALQAMSTSGAAAADAAAASVIPEGISALAVAAAGLLDGVNPCAFTTLIFLLSFLALAGRSRRQVLLIGALFTLAVFLTYLAVGLGLFSALRAASAVPIVSRILRWVLVAALVVFAGLSLYDYLVIRRGEPGKILLQLPSALKRQIHTTIRGQARAAALAGGSLLLGFLVSVFEFACTGQVYLPALAYIARTRREASAVGLLVLYNVFFILPLVAVFAASWFGVTSGRIATLYQKRMGAVKLGLAVVFLGLAAVTLWAG